MKFKFLLASAVAIVGIAVYTLTLSFTHSAPLLSQLEALADGSEVGDGGNTGGESGESSESENPESGQQGGKTYKGPPTKKECPQYEMIKEWTIAPDGTGGWTEIKKYIGMAWVDVIECGDGKGTCTPYKPC